MKKRFQNSVTYLLISISLSIILHSVIPHDHHYSTNCDVIHHRHQHNDTNENQEHCHFFNEIVIEHSFNNLPIEIQKFIPFDFFSIASNRLQLPRLIEKTGNIYRKNILSYSLVYTVNTPVRGSPAV